MSVREWIGIVAIAFVSVQVFTLALAVTISTMMDRANMARRIEILHREAESFLMDPQDLEE